MKSKFEDDFKEYSVGIPCIRKGGEPAIFNCRVCGTKRYFSGHCTPDDCEAGLKDFCNKKERQDESIFGN